MGKLYIVRHSVSYYNELGKFAGNQDIPLSKKGIQDSIALGKKIKQMYPNINLDLVFTSTLSRAFDTAVLLLSELDLGKIPIKISRKRLNNFNDHCMLPIVQFAELKERDYGILQNMDKEDVSRLIDPLLLRKWRRSFYSGPQKGESFEQVYFRTKNFYEESFLPQIKNKDIMIVAHQNTIRALYMLINDISAECIDLIEFANGEIIYIDRFKNE